MTVLRQYNTNTSTWDVFVSGVPGDWTSAQTLSPVTASTGSPLSVTSTHAGLILYNNNGATAVGIKINSGHGIAIGQRVDLLRNASGTFTLTWGAGITVNWADKLSESSIGLRVQYSTATILCTATDTFVITGDIA